MDLGLKGKTALICASSRGLGKACAISLAREGCNVVINGLDEERLRAAADEIRASTDVNVVAVAADINTEAGRAKLIAASPEPDILINNNSGPPPGQLEDWDLADWHAAVESNMLAPIFMIRAVLPGMRARSFGRIVNITSAMVKSPRSPLGLSTSCRAGLTALAKTVSRDVAMDNVTINNLLPERVDTDRQRQMAELAMKKQGISWDEARRRQAAKSPAGRMGLPSEFGDACAFFCSAQAGYITGQNLQLDGGSYGGLV